MQKELRLIASLEYHNIPQLVFLHVKRRFAKDCNALMASFIFFRCTLPRHEAKVFLPWTCSGQRHGSTACWPELWSSGLVFEWTGARRMLLMCLLWLRKFWIASFTNPLFVSHSILLCQGPKCYEPPAGAVARAATGWLSEPLHPEVCL